MPASAAVSTLSANDAHKIRKKVVDLPKVELHIHLDGSVRHQTLLDLSKEKSISLKDAKTIEEVRNAVVVGKPSNLADMLRPFDYFLPLLVGDKDAIERVAYELCEDESRSGVIYFEARYSPHLLANTTKNLSSTLSGGAYSGKGTLTPRSVIEAVNRGFERGEADFNVFARSILCCIQGYPGWNSEVLNLATEFSQSGVVGIDIAGCSLGADEQYPPSVCALFQEAAKRGIHRTVHAGESGGAKEVVLAVDSMCAERIGHGYRVLRDENAYEKYAIDKRVHFETCPTSSVMTGSVPLNWAKHPIKRFADDNINFSINTDDPTCFENSVASEYELAHEGIGLSEKQLWQCSMNAAQSCFANEELKMRIIDKIKAWKL